MEPKKQVGRLTQAQRHFSRNRGLSTRPCAQRERDKEKRERRRIGEPGPERRGKPEKAGPREALSGFARSRREGDPAMRPTRT